MRVIVLIHSMNCGGAERVAANLINYWVSKSFDISLVTLTSMDECFYELNPAVELVSLKMVGNSKNVVTALWHNLLRIHALRKVLRERKPDIVLGMMTTSNILIAFAGQGLGCRLIGSEHIHPPQMPLGSIWEKLRCFVYGMLDAVTALTDESAQWLKKHTHAKLVTVIPNAAPWPLPTSEPRVKPDNVCQTGRNIVLAVGRLDHQKGFDLLIEALINLLPQYPDWDVVILGEGPERLFLETQIQKSHLTGRIFLPGRVGNISDWYERASLYVMSSRFEGFGNTLAEALSHNLPTISFDCDTGPRDIIRHEVDGLLVQPGDVNALENAMSRLMADKELRTRLANRAIEARERFSIERISRMWEHLFEEVLLARRR